MSSSPTTTAAATAVDEEKEEINSIKDVLEVGTFADNEANGSDRSVAESPTCPTLSATSSGRNSTVTDRNHDENEQHVLVNAVTGVSSTFVDERAPNPSPRFFRRLGRQSTPPRSRRCRDGLPEDARDSSIVVDDAQAGNSSTRPLSNIMSGGQQMAASVTRVNSIFFSSLSRSDLPHSLPSQEGSLNNSQILNRTRQRRTSSPFFSLSNVFINASLVEENESDVVVDAEPMGFCYKHGKIIATLSFLALVTLVTIMTLTIKEHVTSRNTSTLSSVPSSAPSLAPSYDPRPTLEIVQERGTLRCGLVSFQVEGTFCFKLCQAIAAVVLNDPDAVDSVYATAESRFVLLNERAMDLHAGGTTYTIEREVNEVTTGSPFTFSTPFYYDGMVFAGNSAFVTCAEERRRFDECSRLVICVEKSTTDYEYVANYFSPGHFVTTTSMKESIALYSNDTCNVVAGSRLGLINFKHILGSLIDESFIIRNKTFNNDPLAFMTRPDDHEWCCIVNWVVQALFFGERQGVTKNSSMCQHSSGTFNLSWPELNYLNAVYCVGNYAELYDGSELAESDRTAINTINNGTSMLYVIPNGNLRSDNDKTFYSLSETFASIKRRGSLNCGLLVQDGYSEDGTTASKRLFGMGVSYCKTLVSSMLHGNVYAVNFTVFQNAEVSLEALNNEAIDVLVGVSADMTRNFGNRGLEGVTFSTPYFYGNQTGKNPVRFYPLMTRRTDRMFSSFVNCIVLSTIYATSEGIDKNNSFAMPSVTIFGMDMLWALKDAISANGNYYEIFSSNFDVKNNIRGRNHLNSHQHPQLLDMPGLNL